MQLLPHVLADHLEILGTCSTWSEDLHVVWTLSSDLFFFFFFFFTLSHRYIVDLAIFGGFLIGRGHKFSEFACLLGTQKVELGIKTGLPSGISCLGHDVSVRQHSRSEH